MRRIRTLSLGAVLLAAGGAGCEKELPTGPSELTSGIVVYEHANYVGRSAHITEDIRDLGEVTGPCQHESGGPVSGSIPYFDWDGETLFLLTSIFRFQTGYLYSYNLASLRLDPLDPLGTSCCYSTPDWSPDGSHVLFAHQDISAASAQTHLYYVPYGTMGTGATYTPLALPAELLTNPRDYVEAVLRPIK